MKLVHMLSVGVATVGITCVVGYASAANTTSGDVIPDSMLLAQSETVAPGGRGGGTAGETGRADKGTLNEHTKQGAPGHTPPKARSGKDAGKQGKVRSESETTGMNSRIPGSSTESTSGGSSGMGGSGSGSSGGSGGGGN